MKYLFLVLLFVPVFSFAQQEKGSVPFQVPETLNQAKDFMEKILMALPNAMGAIWREEVAPVWGKMFAWIQKKTMQQIQVEKEKVSQSLQERFLNLFKK